MPNEATAKEEREQRDNWLTAIKEGLNREDRMQTFLDLLETPAAVERFKAVALHAIVSDRDRIGTCEPLSIIEAVRESAVLGLMPTGLLGEAWIIPYGKLAKLQVGYRGYLKLIRNSGQVAAVDAQIVYMNDYFDVQFGTDPRIVHKPLLFGEKNEQGKYVAERGGYRGAYAWARLKTGELIAEWMPWEDIEAIRKRSPSVMAGRKSPWDTDYGEMMRKTPVRRMQKRLPQSPQMERLMMYDNELDNSERRELEGPQPKQLNARNAAVKALDAKYRQDETIVEAFDRAEAEEAEGTPEEEYTKAMIEEDKEELDRLMDKL